MLNQIRSLYYTVYLKLRGAKVGKSVEFGGAFKVVLRDGASYKNIEIGNNVTFSGETFLRLRKGGKLKIDENVNVGVHVWLVVANTSILHLKKNVILGSYCILNGGHGITIGENSWFAAFVYLNTSDHQIRKGILIQQQGYDGFPISIGQDNWVGGHVFINKNVKTGTGVVVGSGSVVTKSIPDNAVVVGNPARILKYRE